MGIEPKIIVYIAMSLDGYIAKEDGSVDWLENTGNGMEAGYLEFYNIIDTIVMGRKTYDQILTFGEWGYKGKNTYVLTTDVNKETENLSIEFRNDEIEDIALELKEKSESNIWLLGGAEIINAFLEKDLIDEYRITLIPAIIGSGVRLFTADTEKCLDLDKVTEYGGIVELKYKKKQIKIANFEINNYNEGDSQE
jgi:dihydrofolate reductase